jgi:uncharacterized delta-60 repeat protein
MGAGLACVTLLVAMPTVSRAATSVAPFPLDATWAANQPVPGLFRLQLDNLPDLASLVHVFPDGSAIVALGGIDPSTGFGDNRQGIAKLRPDGTLDPTFNSTGTVPGVADQLTTSGIVDIDVDHHGRILLAGTSMVTRLLADGTPDASFITTCVFPCIPGQGEPVPFSPIGMVFVPNRVYDLVVLADDSILVESSNEINQPPFVMHVTKLTATGDRDLTFNSADPLPGVLTVDDLGPGHLVPQPDGSILLVALTSPPRMHRITAGGLLDTTYGTDGTVFPPIASSDETIWQVEPAAADLLFFVARAFPSGTPSLLRVHPDGTTDTTFGIGGRLDLTRLGATINLGSFFDLADGRIIVVFPDGATTSSLARLTADGHLDASFNPASTTPGWLVVDPDPDPVHGHHVFDLAERTNGTYLAVGDRPLRGFSNQDDVAEIYSFNAFPGAPRPIEPYPLASPPPPPPPPPPATISSIGAAANASKPATRKPVP